MVTINDILKTFVKYIWIIVLSAMVGMISLGLYAVFKDDVASYNGKALFTLKSVDEDKPLSSEFAKSQITTLEAQMSYPNYFELVKSNLASLDGTFLAKFITTADYEKAIDFVYTNGNYFFEINVTHEAEAEAKLITNATIRALLDHYNESLDGKVMLLTYDNLTDSESIEPVDVVAILETSSTLMYLIVGCIFGALISMGSLVIIEIFNPKINNKNRIIAQLGVPLLGEIDAKGLRRYI